MDNKVAIEVINPLVAEKVLNWQRKVLPNNEKGHPYYANYWVDKEGKETKATNFWNPSINLQDAWVVYEELRQRDICMVIEPTKDMYKILHNGVVTSENISLSFAICEASLKIMEVEIADSYFIH